MSSRRTILVDVGNSAVKVAVVARPCSPADATRNPSDAAACRRTRALRYFRLDLRDASWPAALLEQSRQLFGFAEEDAGEPSAGASDCDSAAPRRWVVASVNGPASRRLHDATATDAPADEWYELTHGDIPMRAELRNPAAVGIDRLLGASAAWHASLALSSERREPGGSDGRNRRGKADAAVISIDAGSAVTVDLVREGVFLGGAILPGLRLQMASLTQGTDLLPAVTHVGTKPLEIPGRDTVSAMQTGVMLGLSGGIDRLIERYSEGCSSPPHVFLTGGDAAMLEPLLGHSVSRRDDLVLSAIADTAPALGYPLVTENEDGEVC